MKIDDVKRILVVGMKGFGSLRSAKAPSGAIPGSTEVVAGA